MMDLDLLDEEENEDCAFTIGDLKTLAKSYIDLFFIDKVDKSGKPIPQKVLHSDRSVSLVLNLNICTDMPAIYESMSNLLEQKKKGKIPADIRFIMDQLNCCSRRCIPKSFATGIIAVYLEVCMGCSINVNI